MSGQVGAVLPLTAPDSFTVTVPPEMVNTPPPRDPAVLAVMIDVSFNVTVLALS